MCFSWLHIICYKKKASSRAFPDILEMVCVTFGTHFSTNQSDIRLSALVEYSPSDVYTNNNARQID